MPSGSHSSGGGGSHFGGGSSFGGSHFGSSGNKSSSTNSTRVFYGPQIFVFGNKRYVVEGKRKMGFFAVIVLVLICAFTLFAGVLMTSGGNKSKKKIISDYNRYQAMIEYAVSNSDYKIHGVITDSFQSDNCDKYYITYAFPINYIYSSTMYQDYLDDKRNDDLEGNWVLGYSFSVYTNEELIENSYIAGNDILLAISNSKNQINPDTDSIPFDYLGMDINRDGEYVNAVKNCKTGPVIISISIIIIVIGIAVDVVIVLKSKETASATVETQTATPAQNLNPNARHCTYCGTIVNKDENKCPSCGAKVE